MLMIGRLLRNIEARWLILIGLTLDRRHAVPDDRLHRRHLRPHDRHGGLVQGFGMGFVFIPLNTVAFVTLPARFRTDGTAMLTLVRNVASSVGISVVIANLTSKTTTFAAG